MNRQIILVKGVDVQEFEKIRDMVEEGLSSGKSRFCIYGPNELVEIEIIELPDTEAQPTIIHNTTMGITKEEFGAMVDRLVVSNYSRR